MSYRRRCWRCHGAVTETRTRDQIKEKFGSYVRDFIAPPDDTFARGNEAGQITDDFSAAYTACQQIISWGGKIDSKCVITALLRWAETEKYFTRFAGPTTKAAVAALRGEAQPRAFVPVNDNGKATNYGGVNIGGDTDNEAGIELLHSFHGPGILHKLAEAGALVVLTLGAKGCKVLQKSGEYPLIPAINTEVIDTTGAGDTFNASFLYGLSRGWDVMETASFANAAAARSIGILGARSGAAGEAAVRQFISRY